MKDKYQDFFACAHIIYHSRLVLYGAVLDNISTKGYHGVWSVYIKHGIMLIRRIALSHEIDHEKRHSMDFQVGHCFSPGKFQDNEI